MTTTACSSANASPPPLWIGPHPQRRGVFRIESRLWLPRPLNDVFAFFADAGNLETLTPPWLKFEIVTPRPIEMRSGQLIDYRIRLRGFPMRWRSEIQDWNPPYYFVDEMRKGPYRSWLHRHEFAVRDGGTDVIDLVDYAVPGGVLINKLLVERDLRKIFQFRRETLLQLMAQ